MLYRFLYSGAFANTFSDLMVFFVVWIAPWAGIVLVDFFLVRRGRIDIAALYRHHTDSECGDVNGYGASALALGVTAAWLFQVSSIESLQGPLAMALGGLDLSWLAGLGVGGGSRCRRWDHRGRAARVWTGRILGLGRSQLSSLRYVLTESGDVANTPAFWAASMARLAACGTPSSV